jgi:hypothetical protein
MADIQQSDAAAWLAVIGKSLAYLSLSKAIERNPKEYDDVLAKVKFLRGLGLSEKDAADATSSTL